MTVQQNQIVQPTMNGTDIFYRTPVQAIITDGMSLDDYIRNTTGVVGSGSNANGSYVKLADGTLICYGEISAVNVPAGTGAYGLVTLPVSMYDSTYKVFTKRFESGAYWATVECQITDKISTSFNIRYWNNSGNDSSNKDMWVAVGRWKDYDVSVLPDETESTIINSASTNYYDDERVVGVWRDGKPLYRKVILFTSTSALGTGVSWETIVDAKMMVHNSVGWRSVPWLFNSTDTSWMGGFYLYDTDNTVRFQLGSNLGSFSYGHIILLYTKLSDVAVTSQTKDILTVVNGKNITDLETIIQQRIDQLLEDKLKERKVATAKMTSNKTFSANVKYTMDSIISNTDKLTLSDGGIRIGAGITQVLVSAQAFNQASSNSGYFWTSIRKNSTNVSICISSPSSYYSSNAHSPVLIDVVEGDILYLYDIGSSATGTIRLYPNTYLTVEIVKEQG